MNVIVKHIPHSVNLNEPIKKTYIDTLLATEDNLAHCFDIALARDGEAVTLPDGAAVTAYFIRYSDNATISLTGTASGNVISVTLNKSCYNKAGQYAVIIKVVADGVTNTVFYGEGTILASMTDTILDPENVVPSLSDLLAQIAAMEATTKAANTATTNANDAADNANSAADKIDGMTVSAVDGTAANAAISEVNGVKHIAFTLPKGDKGDKGDPGNVDNVTITSIEGLQEALDGKQPTGNYLTSESDPTVPEWAKKASKPSYTASEVGALPSDGTAADASKLGGVDAADYLLKADALVMDLLWTNASTTSEFAAQTVTVDLSSYDFVGIVFRFSTTNAWRWLHLSRKGYSESCQKTGYPSGNIFHRQVTTDNSKVQFYDSYKWTSSSSQTASNGNMIPIEIYGIKGVS